MAIQDDYVKSWKYIQGDEIDEPAYNVFKRVKLFIMNNPDDQISINIKEWLYKEIKSAFTNPKLDQAFNMSDDHAYAKQAEIFSNLPSMVNFNELKEYFWALIFHDSDYYGTPLNFYKGCKWYCNELHPGEIPDELFDRVIKYTEDNTTIMKAGFNHYNDFNTEYTALKNLSFGIATQELRDRYTSIEYLLLRNGEPADDYSIKEYITNEKKGIVGEYFIYEKLKRDFYRTTFVSKEYGNGFGYDVLAVDPYENKEWLIEVKATTNTISTDKYFTLTKNEKDVLEDSLKRDKTEFVIERVFIDLDRNQCINIPLYYDKFNKCFYNNYAGYNFKYEVDKNNPLLFNAANTKKNTLTYKNNNQ